MRGGERVLECLCDLFPDADIFTLVADRSRLSEKILRHSIRTSFLQRIGGRTFYKKMLPLMPYALEAFDLIDYDLIISSESGPAKGIIPGPEAVHICYCHSPMRYIWDLSREYSERGSFVTKAFMRLTGPSLRQWDVTTAARVDHFVANSQFVARRIEKYYRREATVINPPVDISRFHLSQGSGEYYLCAGQVTPYKRVDIAIDAFSRLALPLLVIGKGVSTDLRRSAGPTVRFLENVSDAEMAAHFSKCKALVFPGLEDFGIVPLEVMASGRPVIAYGRGGALETVVPGETGLLFEEQSVAALIDAVRQFEAGSFSFDPVNLRNFASRFDRERFSRRMADFIRERTGAGMGIPQMTSHDPSGAKNIADVGQ